MKKVRPAFLMQFGIAFVVYRLKPLVAGLFARHFHGNVAEPAARPSPGSKKQLRRETSPLLRMRKKRIP